MDANGPPGNLVKHHLKKIVDLLVEEGEQKFCDAVDEFVAEDQEKLRHAATLLNDRTKKKLQLVGMRLGALLYRQERYKK